LSHADLQNLWTRDFQNHSPRSLVATEFTFT
jgi:hypothetical protein